jgi:hypothetical protein
VRRSSVSFGTEITRTERSAIRSRIVPAELPTCTRAIRVPDAGTEMHAAGVRRSTRVSRSLSDIPQPGAENPPDFKGFAELRTAKSGRVSRRCDDPGRSALPDFRF